MKYNVLFCQKEPMAKVQIKGLEDTEIDLTASGEMILNGHVFTTDRFASGTRRFHLLKDGKAYKIEIHHVDNAAKTVSLSINGKKAELAFRDKMDILLEKLGMSAGNTKKANELKAPMPGLIIDLKVAEGSQVKTGDQLVVLEAMKMENVLKSPGEGVVGKILVKIGQSVEKNQVLISFS